MKRRGFSLGIVLILGMVCLSIALLVSSMAVFQLDAAQTARAREQALHLAEAALAQTVDAEWTDLTQNPMQTYGSPSDGVKFLDPSDAGNFGQTTFDTTSPWGYCTNNCTNSPSGGNSSAGWEGVSVPASSCYIVARGVVGNTTVKVEAMLSAPEFQFALACQGPISATNALIVKAEPSMGALATDTLLASSMAANVGSNTSVTAGSNSLVTGDVVASGPVDLSAPSLVDGVIRPGTITPPTFNIPSYDNSGANPATLDTSTNPVVVSQNTYFNGPLTINGELKMQNATLYVQGGPVTINGALDGTGALIVNGSVTLNGGADLDASNLVALLSSGDVALNGSNGAQKYFQGLVYCDGAFSASSITIAGAFVSAPGAGSTATDSGLSLGPGTQVVYVPAAANILASSTSASDISNFSANARTYLNQPLQGAVWNQPNPAPSNVPWCPMVSQADTHTDFLLYQAVKMAPLYSNQMQFLLDSSASGTYSSGPQAAVISNGESSFICGAPGIQIGTANFWLHPYDSNANYWPNLCINYCGIQYDPTTNRFIPLNPPQVAYAVQTNASNPGQPLTAAQFANLYAQIGTTQTQQTSPAQLVAFFKQAQDAYMAAANQMLANPASAGVITASVPNLTLNNFLSSPSPLHLVSWREAP